MSTRLAEIIPEIVQIGGKMPNLAQSYFLVHGNISWVDPSRCTDLAAILTKSKMAAIQLRERSNFRTIWLIIMCDTIFNIYFWCRFGLCGFCKYEMYILYVKFNLEIKLLYFMDYFTIMSHILLYINTYYFVKLQVSLFILIAGDHVTKTKEW